MGGCLSDLTPGSSCARAGCASPLSGARSWARSPHGAAEHLSADEIHARAAAVVPELGRGTVYATLAELTELGILAARGSPEPVRYETNTEPHQHFRCRLCLRLFDVELADPAPDALAAAGFVVEQMTITAEGVCAECVAYDKGLRAGAKRARSRPSPTSRSGIAATTADTPRRHADARRDARRGRARRLRRPRRRRRARRGDRRPPRRPRRPRAPRRREGRRRGVLRRPPGRRVRDRLGPPRRRGHAPRRDGRPARAPSVLRRARHARGRGRAGPRARAATRWRSSCPATASHAATSSPAEYVGGVERRLALLELEPARL